MPWTAKILSSFGITKFLGNQIFYRISAFVLVRPRCASCAMSIARCCKARGITILCPLRRMPLAVTVNSSLMCLKDSGRSVGHVFVRKQVSSAVKVLSVFVAVAISSRVMARGTVCCSMKFTYSSAMRSGCDRRGEEGWRDR